MRLRDAPDETRPDGDAVVYRKRGRVVRVENGTLLDIAERGTAYERDGVFMCEPEEGTRPEALNPAAVLDVAARIRSGAHGAVCIERLIVSEGVAEHTIGDAEWSERMQRIHLSLTSGLLRVVIDLGSFELADVSRTVAALARAEQETRPAPKHVRLAPGVAAALLASVAGRSRSDVRIVQSEGGIDGMGAPIREHPADAPPWPNWYRPSYRHRPVRAPLNVHAVAGSREIDGDLPVAVALLEPVGGASLRVLIEERECVYPSVVDDITIRAISDERIWYPYGAGSFGAEMVL